MREPPKPPPHPTQPQAPHPPDAAWPHASGTTAASHARRPVGVPGSDTRPSGRYWAEITQSTYDFQRKQRDVAVLRTLGRAELQQTWMELFDTSSSRRRKLSTQSWSARHSLPPRAQRTEGGRRLVYADGLNDVLALKRAMAAYPAPARQDQPGSA